MITRVNEDLNQLDEQAATTELELLTAALEDSVRPSINLHTFLRNGSAPCRSVLPFSGKIFAIYG
ncbi:hypothetical protein [Limosilactobacillus pontis]|uniref:hypothetical protein n=1 Tax=Limosilactobacillus pontis TaxID=35787 RepID=UPI002246D28A|nr:hypothetical protein [Limosilactobacillus pontis]MCX2186208.1 hypothetical protein [Limosilactobacillus pontis]MCX2187894.1 hypothetical protein [Limosilactobacillus pontis]